MRKKSLLFVFSILLLSLTVTSYAEQARTMGNLSILTFENGMAVCRVFRTADSSTDKVVVNVTLYRGWDVVGAWTGASVTEQVKAVEGAEYTMSITWSVAGQWQRSETIRKTYTG